MSAGRLRCVTAVGLNTALDRTLEVERLEPGTVHVVGEERLAAGGKALNVVRALGAMGVCARALAFSGGPTGRTLRALARREGLAVRFVRTEGESRVCTVVVDPEHGATVLNGRGPAVAGGELQTLEDLLMRRAARGDAIVLTGSLPPGVPASLYGEWTRRVRAHGAGPVALDAHGDALAGGLAALPDVVKVNALEFGALPGPGGAAARARALLDAGIGLVVVTRGGEGALAFAPDGAWRVPVAPVRAVNATGSGDVFLAGLLAGRALGLDLPGSLALAAAAAGLNAARLEAGPDDLASVRALAREIHPERLREDGSAPGTKARA